MVMQPYLLTKYFYFSQEKSRLHGLFNGYVVPVLS